jgi:hypothetical protein
VDDDYPPLGYLQTFAYKENPVSRGRLTVLDANLDCSVPAAATIKTIVTEMAEFVHAHFVSTVKM